ncbi:protein of unknown function [Moritella yayanosii]|uniref:Uncharacterized protein n=1 Tax=Moritella yayanosii TaxID=69539 RepID=A0A330LSR1_9GAMM|nr:protein of unknown function [Moritella yayanosii]
MMINAAVDLIKVQCFAVLPRLSSFTLLYKSASQVKIVIKLVTRMS